VDLLRIQAIAAVILNRVGAVDVEEMNFLPQRAEI
jgi:hypothetical protein